MTRTADAASCHAVESGTGRAVLFIHGGFLDHRMYLPQLAMAPPGQRRIAIDLPGFGQSPPLDGPFTLENLAATTLQQLDRLGPGKFDIFGTSLGAGVAIHLALMAPDAVGRLVLCSCSTRAGTPGRTQVLRDLLQSQGIAPVAESFTNAMLRGEQDRSLERAIGEMARAMPPATALALFDLIDSYPDLASKIVSLPHRTLLLSGENDPGMDLSLHREIARTSTDCRAGQIPHAGHLPTLSQPSAVERVLARFLSAV